MGYRVVFVIEGTRFDAFLFRVDQNAPSNLMVASFCRVHGEPED